MSKFCFVILHYMSLEDTKKCIESINNYYSHIEIVVVDNGSSNGSGKELEKIYKEEKNITVILIENNLGFAKGNNVGYRYAKDRLKAEFVIVINNDIIFTQNSFLDKCQELYEKEKYFVLGPDIITPENTHQNPFRLKRLSLKEVRKSIINKKIFRSYYKIKKALYLGDKVQILEKMFDKKSEERRDKITYKKQLQEVVLQGACLIYSPLYVQKEDIAFAPETFLYGEEDLLAYFCFSKNYKMLYSPEIRVIHMEGASTKSIYGKSLERNLFFTEHALRGAKILLKKMRGEVHDFSSNSNIQ